MMRRVATAPKPPWVLERRKLRAQRTTPRNALLELVGEEETERAMHVFTRVPVDCSSTERKKARSGRDYAPPRTARAPALAPEPVRGEDTQVVVRLVLLYCSLMVGLRPGTHRVGGPRLYVGDPTGQRAAGLGRQLMNAKGRPTSNREIERYLAIFRTHDVGPKAWQPNGAAAEGKIPRSRRGNPYNVYEWGTLPARLETHVQTWWAQLQQSGRSAERAKAVAPVAPPPGREDKRTASASSFAASLLSKVLDDAPS